MPLEIPQVFQGGKFYMPVSANNIDRARQPLPDVHLAGSGFSTGIAMASDQAPLHFIVYCRASGIKVESGLIRRFWPEVWPIGIYEVRCAGGLRN